MLDLANVRNGSILHQWATDLKSDVMTQQIFAVGEVTPTNYFMTIAAVLAVLFSLIDRQSDMPFVVNVLLWLFQSIVPMYLMIQSHKIAVHLKVVSRLNPWLSILLSGCVGAMVFVPFAFMVDVLIANDPWPATYGELMLGLVDEAAGVMPPVVICWLAINAPWVYGFQIVKRPPLIEQNISAMPQQSPPQAAANTAIPHALLALIPAQKRGELMYLKSELHYLSVVTTTGQSLILFNLKDAIEACAMLDGIQPHRSYWVCAAAIKEYRKQGREGSLILTDGTEIPVSRHRASDVAKYASLRT